MKVIISFVIDICQAQTTTQYAIADSPMICAYAVVGIGSYAEHVLLSEEEMQDERASILSVLRWSLSSEVQAAEAGVGSGWGRNDTLSEERRFSVELEACHPCVGAQYQHGEFTPF